MQTADAVVRLKTLDGDWEVCGVDRLRGVWPEAIQLDSNRWGADTASFTLKREAGSIWPDMLAFTPVEIEVAGILVWDGFISQTPTTEADGGSVNVQCKGWQYHLDDDSFEKVWVASMPSQWKDAREFQAAQPNYYRPNYSVSIGDGNITLGFGKGVAMRDNTYAAVIFDAGPDNTIAAIAATWSIESGDDMSGSTGGGIQVYAKAANSLPSLATTFAAATNAFGTGGVTLGTAGTTKATGGTFSTPGRYVLLGLRWTGGNISTAFNYMAKFTSVSLASSSTYYNGTTKTITGPVASTIISDCLAKAPLLSQSADSITTTSFATPHFSALDGGRTPRELMEAANSYHDNVLKVAPGKSLVFKPKPAAPTVEIGNWGGSQFEDAAANSADEIYNKVIIEGTGPDGLPLRVPRTAANLGLSSRPALFVDEVPNSTFSTGTSTTLSGWTNNASTYQTLGTTSTSPISGTSSGKWTLGSPTGLGSMPANTVLSITGTLSAGSTFKAGTTYTSTLSMQSVFSNQYFAVQPNMRFGTTTDYQEIITEAYAYNYGNAYPLTIAWTPTADVASSAVKLTLTVDSWIVDNWQQLGIANGDYMLIDDWVVTFSKPTLPDRWGFTRTKRLQVESMLNTTAAIQLGDTYLASRSSTPLKGSIEVSAGGVRDYLSGASVHPAHLLLEVGERIHLSHRIDPDTGSAGRMGDIAGVSYSHDNQRARVSVDSQRNNFEALLSRLSVVTSTALGR